MSEQLKELWIKVRWIISHWNKQKQVHEIEDTDYDMMIVWNDKMLRTKELLDIIDDDDNNKDRVLSCEFIKERFLLSLKELEFDIKEIKQNNNNNNNKSNTNNNQSMYLIKVPFHIITNILIKSRYKKKCQDNSWYPFSLREAQQGRFGIFKEDRNRSYYNSIEIYYTINTLINSITLSKDGLSLIGKLNKYQMINLIPMHKKMQRERIFWDIMMSWIIKKEYIERVGVYFGSEIGFYFAWTSCYINFLLVLSIISIYITYYYYDMNDNNYFNSYISVLYSLVIFIWSTVFLEYWKQTSSRYAYSWGVHEYEIQEKTQQPRPEFKGVMKTNIITNKLEPHYSNMDRYMIYAVTYPIVFLCIYIVIKTMLLCFYLEDITLKWAEIAYFNVDFLDNNAPIVVRLLYSISVLVLNIIYTTYIVPYLMDMENHRTKSNYNKHQTIKLILFYFVNGYLGLLYASLYLQDILRLQEHLVTIFISRQFFGNIIESLIPYLYEKYHVGVAMYNNQQLQQQHNDDNINILHSWQSEYEKPISTDIFDEYLELVMQYGYIVMFGFAWPLSSFFALLNNIVEIRLDSHKLCILSRRPRHIMTGDIGLWYYILQIMSVLGIIINFIILCIIIINQNDNNMNDQSYMYISAIFLPDDVIETIIKQYNNIHIDMNYIDVRLLPTSVQIIIIVVLEHIIICLKIVIMEIIPDIPSDIEVNILKDKHSIDVATST